MTALLAATLLDCEKEKRVDRGIVYMHQRHVDSVLLVRPYMKQR
jgi:CTP:phosphocholine cytidylyltransferase-like protein